MKVAPFYADATSTEPQDEPEKLFDVSVTRVVASVYAGKGDASPRVTAFRIIAMEEVDGEYSFPDEDGRKITVNVSTEERSH